MTMKKKGAYTVVITLLTVVFLCDGMSVKQMKNMAKFARMNCQSKTNASDGEIDLIKKGIFSGASKDVKCYIACIMKMAGTVRNTILIDGCGKRQHCCIGKRSGKKVDVFRPELKGSDFNYESAMKQADSMLPEDKKKPMKEALTACKNSSDPYKDPCEAAYHLSKCFYNRNPEMFYIP